MNLINLLQKRNEKIEDTKEILFELQTGLIGAEVTHQGKEAILTEVDWTEKQVLLNYDDVNMEWISFS